MIMHLVAALGLLLCNATPARASQGQAARVLWRTTVDGWGEPAIDGRHAYVLTRTHHVVSLALSDGREQWRSETGGPGEAPLGSAVRLSAQMVVVGDDAVVAFDRQTGATRWRFVPNEGYGAGIHLGDADEEVVVAGSASGHVYAIDGATGRLRWARKVVDGDGGTVFPPLLVADRVIVSYTAFDKALRGGVVAYGRDGRPLWHRRFSVPSGAAGPPRAAAGERVVVARTDGAIDAFTMRNGRNEWTLPRARGSEHLERDIRALAVAGDIVVAGSLTGTITGYDLHARRERWRWASTSGAVAMRLTADGEDVFAPLTDGRLVQLSAMSGVERWGSDGAPDAIRWPPGAHASHVVAVGDHGVIAFERRGAEPAASGARQEER
jgi:outer membrane protein assembly factor BamB